MRNFIPGASAHGKDRKKDEGCRGEGGREEKPHPDRDSTPLFSLPAVAAGWGFGRMRVGSWDHHMDVKSCRVSGVKVFFKYPIDCRGEVMV